MRDAFEEDELVDGPWVAIAVGLVLVFFSAYTVSETEQVILTSNGGLLRPDLSTDSELLKYLEATGAP